MNILNLKVVFKNYLPKLLLLKLNIIFVIHTYNTETLIFDVSRNDGK